MSRLSAVALAAVVLSLSACKSKPQMDLPLYPGASKLPGGGERETAEANLLHVILVTADPASQVRNFYRAELGEKRGWTADGDNWSDGNLEHLGDFGSGGDARPKDGTKPGGWVGIAELNNETRIDLWRALPKSK